MFRPRGCLACFSENPGRSPVIECTMEPERERFVAEWKATGRRLDMGKSCVRFLDLQDEPLLALGRAVHSISVEALTRMYEPVHDF